MNNIQQLAQQLAEQRRLIAMAREECEELRALVEQTEEWKAYQNRASILQDLNEKEARIKGQLGDAMLNQRDIDGTMKFDNIGQIVNTTQVLIHDSEALLVWAKSHNLFLTVDEKAVKKVAEQVEPDGVRIEKGYATRIHSDLSVLLDK